jgi:hypothetical protein
VRPRNHYDASSKASRMFNSTPTFPGIDFSCGCLLSFCVDGLLETPRLLATPRPYGTRRSVLAWSGWFRHLTYATSCRTSESRTSRRLIDNRARSLLAFRENEISIVLAIPENMLRVWLLASFGDRQMMAQHIARRWLVSPLINKDFRGC